MTPQSLKVFIQHNMLNCLECSPAVATVDNQRIYVVTAYIKTPVKSALAELYFQTDRPFTEQLEVVTYFTRLGVTKDKIFFVFPKGSDNYRTAEHIA